MGLGQANKARTGKNNQEWVVYGDDVGWGRVNQEGTWFERGLKSTQAADPGGGRKTHK